MPDERPPSPKAKPARNRSAAKRAATSGEIIPISVHAEQSAKEVRVKLLSMVEAATQLRANRRRATAIDRVDLEAAFDDIVNPIPRPKRVDFIGDVCGIVGAGFIGYSINIYTGTGPIHLVGHIAILSVVGACLKYIDTNK